MLPPARSGSVSRTWRDDLAVILLFVGLTALVTYPQVRFLGTHVPYSSDPYFSIWRLGWVAHAIVTSPRELFQANIFYPAPATLGYSDAILLPGILTAPFFWAEINPVLIYNVAFLAAFVLSGWAAFRLALRLTAHVPASIVAGIIFAFTPYRFCHYMHLEMQIVPCRRCPGSPRRRSRTDARRHLARPGPGRAALFVDLHGHLRARLSDRRGAVAVSRRRDATPAATGSLRCNR
jgi:hypothetical protein